MLLTCGTEYPKLKLGGPLSFGFFETPGMPIRFAISNCDLPVVPKKLVAVRRSQPSRAWLTIEGENTRVSVTARWRTKITLPDVSKPNVGTEFFTWLLLMIVPDNVL